MRVLEIVSACPTQAQRHSFKGAIKNQGTNIRRRGPRIDAGRRSADKGKAVELAWPHLPPGRELRITASANQLYRANAELALQR